MNRIRILDCTLRDGGRIVDCNFENIVIRNIADELALSGIEIVELGFLRDEKLLTYNGNSTFFTKIEQMDSFVNINRKTMFCAFIDYLMFDFDTLPSYRGKGVEGIRVGFTKKQYCEDKSGVIAALKSVKEKGYKLFVQSVNTPGYSDKELLEIIENMNEIKPYSFGIVDTYGSLYLDEITHLFEVVERNLDESICIDIHSHNNMQSSFAFAQEISRIAPIERKIILDSTLNGMGKCAGNLNTELIVDYLNRKKAASYNLDEILDIIDVYLEPIKERCSWGYSIPAFMAGIYKSHPNNIIYLTEKYRLRSKDIKYIISGISEDKRQRYDYTNIAKVYKEYFSTVYDDRASMNQLNGELDGKNVVILAPGNSINIYKDKIREVVKKTGAIVISINFIPKDIKLDFLFCANSLHWKKLAKERFDKERCILSSNVKNETQNTIVVNYSSLIEEGSELPDNSTMMLLKLLEKVGVKHVFIAGFDGIKKDASNYVNDSFINSLHGMTVERTNKIISDLFRNYIKRTNDRMQVELITPSLYESL